MSTAILVEWMKAQKLKAPSMKAAPTFYRNLEEALDVRRRDHNLFTIKSNICKEATIVDFSSNDTLSLGASGVLRAALDEELVSHPNIAPGAASSRVMDGNYAYLETVEREIAAFHGAETGLLLSSGFEANLAIFAAVPRPGDVIVYDELVHASTHDGMQQSQALVKLPFRHNNVESFRDVLASVHDTQPLVRTCQRCVIVAVESFYSMDGDVCPLSELVEAAKEMFPGGNAQFLVDEAHSTGVVGPKGSGLVCELGLEKEIAIRLHTFGKAISASGAIVLGNETLKHVLLNLARPVIYTTAPAFPTVATVRAAYKLMESGRTENSQARVQDLMRYFFATISSNSIWNEAVNKGIFSVPLSDDWEEQPFLTHVVPIWTRERYSFWLVFHLYLAGYSSFPVEYPTVPKGQSRIRLAFHANNTNSQIDGLIAAICEWAQEMMEIEKGGGRGSGGRGTTESRIPKAAKMVYAMLSDESPDILEVAGG